MSDDFRTLDPEVENLLREIAEGPGGGPLQVSPNDLGRSLFERRPRVEATAAFLTTPQRYLLETHRYEVACLLRAAARFLLDSSPQLRTRLSRNVTVDRELQSPAVGSLSERLKQVVRASANDDTAEAVKLLGRCFGIGEHPSAHLLLTTSLGLVPSDSARICLGIDFFRLGEHERARAVIEGVLATSPDQLTESYAWQNLGMIEADRGNLARAAEADRRATVAHGSRIAPAIDWFLMSVQIEDSDVFKAASILDDTIPADHPAIGLRVDDVRTSRDLGLWSPTSGSLRFLSSVEDDLGPIARRIACVFE